MITLYYLSVDERACIALLLVLRNGGKRKETQLLYLPIPHVVGPSHTKQCRAQSIMQAKGDGGGRFVQERIRVISALHVVLRIATVNHAMTKRIRTADGSPSGGSTSR